ncbi:MAG: YciI family protein [Desertimonas sp.]
MKYFVLLASYGEMATWEELTPEQQEEGMAKHMAFSEACEARADVAIVAEEALGDGSTSTTLRTRGGELSITDGPFAEVAEHIGGFYVLEAPDLDTVIEMCRILPAYDIEIRPVLDVG